jgi:hypothetical protein
VGSANITRIKATPETIASFPRPLRRPLSIGDIAITFSLLSLSIRNSPNSPDLLQQKAAQWRHVFRESSGRLLYSLPQRANYTIAAAKINENLFACCK